MRLPLLPILAVAALPGAASAAPAAACHCYRERAWDPGRPAAADPYVLATTRSSLLSAAFGPSKASLVRAVMTGTSPDDLWIAYAAAARTGGEAGALLDAREDAGSWKAALAPLAAKLGPALGGAVARGDAALAAAAVDGALVGRLGVPAAAVHALRAGGATNEETILAAFLAPRLRAPAPEVLARARAGASWGALLHEAGLAPEGIDAAVRAAVL